MGCANLCEKVYDEDCPIIKILRESGAIFLVRGNTPTVRLSLPYPLGSPYDTHNQ
jgi:hypothetical protein